MVKLKIDKYLVEAKEGLTLMEVIDEVYMQATNNPNKVKDILPRLCNHEALEPYAACRLCVVEVEKNGWKNIETSCNYKIKEGLVVKTDTEAVKESRKTSIELLLAKAPDAEIIKDLAFKLGAEKNKRYGTRGDNYLKDCIDCGLCARVCNEIVGKSAIAITGRGVDKHISTPYDKPSDDCIGCGACAYICPTNAIKIEEENGVRKIWGKEFEMKSCETCGSYFATQAQIEHLKKKFKLKDKNFNNCPKCSPKEIPEIKVESDYKIEISEEICKSCGRCVIACPEQLFTISTKFNKKSYNPAVWSPVNVYGKEAEKGECVGCEACRDVCPEAAIDIKRVKKDVRIIGEE